MSGIEDLFLSTHALFVTLVVALLFIILLSVEDELQQYALNRSVKTSVVITTLSLVGYSFYMLTLGVKSIGINVLFFGVEELASLTLLLYYLELKGVSFSFKKSNDIVTNVLLSISIAISVLATISLLLELDYFANNAGLIRYDELILYLNTILLSVITPFVPKIRKRLSREEYKKREKELDRTFNVIYIVYGLFMVGFIVFALYRKGMI